MLAGLIGSILPVLPGTPLVLIAAIGHRLYFGEASISNLVLAVMVGLTLVSLCLNFWPACWVRKNLAQPGAA